MTILDLAILLAENGDKDVPVALFLPLAFAIPIGVLVVFSLIKPRGGGH